LSFDFIFMLMRQCGFLNYFFPSSDSTNSVLLSLATFSIAFLSRPLGSGGFGHYGDKVGRKTTLVIALLTMGISTVYWFYLDASIGAAPLLLMLCFGQGVGLGGEWGGAVLAIEMLRLISAWYGMFPQLGRQ
jgi:MFS family permease